MGALKEVLKKKKKKCYSKKFENIFVELTPEKIEALRVPSYKRLIK